VENLCKALRAGIKTNEKDIVKALIASVSNRLYTQDKAKDAQLMSQNTIITLGHIAVALRHEEKVAENILIFFQQKFCRSHSNPDMDKLIVDQLGCMAIARTDNEDKVSIDHSPINFSPVPNFVIVLTGHEGDCTCTGTVILLSRKPHFAIRTE